MKRYIKPETDIVCTDALNDITNVSDGLNEELGGNGQGAKGFNGWDEEADDFGW